MRDFLNLSAFVTLLTMVNSGLGFLAQAFIANKFGSSIDVDAYFFSLSYPVFISAIFSSFISYSLVPKLVSCEKNPSKQNQYFSSLLFFLMLISVLIAIFVPILVDAQYQILSSKGPLIGYNNIENLIYIAWAVGILQTIQAYLSNAFNAYFRPIIAVLILTLSYLGMLMGIIFIDYFGIISVSMGMLVGIVLSIALGLYFIRDKIVLKFNFEDVRTQFSRGIYYVLGLSCFSSYAAIDSIWATISQPGSLSQLSYSQRIIIAIGNLAIAAPSAMLVPRFVRVVAENNNKSSLCFFYKSLFILGAIIFFIMMVLFIFSSEIIGLLFMRGAFSSTDKELVSTVLENMVPGGFFMLMSVLLFRYLFSLPNTEKTLAVIGVFWTVLYYILSSRFYEGGSQLIAFCYSLTWFFTFLILLIYSKLVLNDI